MPSSRSYACEHGHAAERLEVRDRRGEAGEQLVRRRARLEPAGRPARTAPGAPCRAATTRAARAVRRRRPRCGPQNLYAERDEDVAAERLHVDGLVRGVLHRVDPRRARRPRARARRRAERR